MLEQIDTLNREVSTKLDANQRARLGQYMTPSRIARFMASLFADCEQRNVSLLDAGAGIGSLTAAFLSRVQNGWGDFAEIQATAYEVDPDLLQALKGNLIDYQHLALEFGIVFSADIRAKDFIEHTILKRYLDSEHQFDYAILNPPYKKINSHSSHRSLLSTVGIETVNLYTAFVALSIMQMKQGGQIVAIIPRSFCNGPYYKPFRELMLRLTAIRQIHLFESRSKPFGEDAVLQENIIIHLVKGEPQQKVVISTSTDDTFADLKATNYEFAQIVKPDDLENFIHVPTGHQEVSLELPAFCRYSLAEIGIDISTGPVVDFRVSEHLQKMPNTTTVPLLYPAHFGRKYIDWPKADFKKSNAISLNSETLKWLYPAGYYTTVKRFSSKEEKKRIVARVIDPAELPNKYYGFENHLNVFHTKKSGLNEKMALGLAVYLNSSIVDRYFRQFNGHTQVNATDLRILKYPSRNTLETLGEWAKSIPEFEQFMIDQKIASFA